MMQLNQLVKLTNCNESVALLAMVMAKGDGREVGFQDGGFFQNS